MIQHSVRRAGVMQFLYYAGLAGGANYFTLYYRELLLDSQGNTLYGVIGTIMLVQSLVAFLSPLIAGFMADKYQITNRLISICAFAVALASGLIILPGLAPLAHFSLSTKLMFIFPGAVIGNFFIKPLVPLIDTGTIKALESSGSSASNYGMTRVFGSIGWIISCLIMGRWLDFTGRLTDAFLVYGLFFVVLGLIATGGFNTSVKKVDIHWSYLFQDKTLRTIVVMSLGRMFGFGMAFIFTGVFLSELNMSYTQMGMAFGLAAILELPLFFWSDKLLKLFGAKKLIMADLFLQIIRFGIFFMLSDVQNAWFYVMVQTLMGLGVSLHVTGVIPLLNKIAPAHLKASYQNIYSVSMAGANIFTGFTASFIVGKWGTRSLMGICAIIMAATLLYSALRIHLPSYNDERGRSSIEK